MDRYEAAAEEIYKTYFTPGPRTLREACGKVLPKYFPPPTEPTILYALDQHKLICELLGVSESPDEPGDTAFEAVVALKDKLPPSPEILSEPDEPGLWWCKLNCHDAEVFVTDGKKNGVYYKIHRAHMEQVTSIMELYPGRYQRIPDAVWPGPEKLPDWNAVPRVLVQYVEKYTGYENMAWICKISKGHLCGMRCHDYLSVVWDRDSCSIVPHPDNDPDLVRQIVEAQSDDTN